MFKGTKLQIFSFFHNLNNVKKKIFQLSSEFFTEKTHLELWSDKVTSMSKSDFISCQYIWKKSNEQCKQGNADVPYRWYSAIRHKYMWPMCKQGNHTIMLPYPLLDQNPLCLLNITYFKSWYSHISMLLKSTLMLTNNCESDMVQTSPLFLSYCETTCPVFTTAKFNISRMHFYSNIIVNKESGCWQHASIQNIFQLPQKTSKYAGSIFSPMY